MQKIYTKKSLGQNFLQSKTALQKIIEAGDVSSDDFILEIGPGKGALTEYLLATGAKVFAIETDFVMIEFLQEKFNEEIKSGQFVLIRNDILKFDLASTKELSVGKYKLIANIPYYITGEIIRKFLSERNYPKKMVLLVQKEVADRIIARDEKESILSVATKAYCNPKFIDTVKAGSFVPAPKVDSAIILFDHISKKLFLDNEINERDFFEILKTGFAHKRKRLFSNLKAKFDFNESEICAELNLDKNIRSENLKTKDWVELTKHLGKNK